MSEYLELDIMNLMEDVQAHINELTSTQVKEVASKKQETASSIFDDFYSGFGSKPAPAKEIEEEKKGNKAKNADDVNSKILNSYNKLIFYSD